MTANKTIDMLGDKAEYLLYHKCKTILKNQLHLPGPDFVDRIWINSDRNPTVLRNLQHLYSHGRLAKTGYLLFSQLTRVSSIVPGRPLRRVLFTLTPRI